MSKPVIIELVIVFANVMQLAIAEDKNINTASDQINKSPEPEPEAEEEEEPDTEENALLKTISPQTMGLLAPGVNNYNYYYDSLYESERELSKAPVKRRLKGDFRA